MAAVWAFSSGPPRVIRRMPGVTSSTRRTCRVRVVIGWMVMGRNERGMM